VVHDAPRHRWTLLPAAVLGAATLAGCTSSPAPKAAASVPSASIVSSTPATSSNTGGRSDLVPVPFDIAAYSPAVTSLTLQYRIGMCESFDDVQIEHSTSARYGQPLRVTTITLWVHGPANGCIGGISPPATTTVHLTAAPMGCNAELIDGATGHAATFVSGVEPPIWYCPGLPAPSATNS
jgi:hypothetical protein